MGDTIWVDLQGRNRGEVPADNSIMLRLEKQLANLSSRLKVAKLTKFYAYDNSWFKKWAWFGPAKALPAVIAIHDHLQRNPQDLGFEPGASRRHWPESLMKELLQCRHELERAAANGKKFRFLIVS